MDSMLVISYAKNHYIEINLFTVTFFWTVQSIICILLATKAVTNLQYTINNYGSERQIS